MVGSSQKEVSATSKDSEMTTPNVLKRVFTRVVTHSSQIDPPGNRITESNFQDCNGVPLLHNINYTVL